MAEGFSATLEKCLETVFRLKDFPQFVRGELVDRACEKCMQQYLKGAAMEE